MCLDMWVVYRRNCWEWMTESGVVWWLILLRHFFSLKISPSACFWIQTLPSLTVASIPKGYYTIGWIIYSVGFHMYFAVCIYCITPFLAKSCWLNHSLSRECYNQRAVQRWNSLARWKAIFISYEPWSTCMCGVSYNSPYLLDNC